MFSGEEIRKKRKSLGLSAAELAILLNVSRESLYKWEKGHRPNNAEEYIRLEKWLNGKLENVPHENMAEEPQIPYIRKRQELKNGTGHKVPVYGGYTTLGNG